MTKLNEKWSKRPTNDRLVSKAAVSKTIKIAAKEAALRKAQIEILKLLDDEWVFDSTGAYEEAYDVLAELWPEAHDVLVDEHMIGPDWVDELPVAYTSMPKGDVTIWRPNFAMRSDQPSVVKYSLKTLEEVTK